MKLRIRGASLRLRLTQGEIARLAQQGEVQDAVPFDSTTRLVYRLRRDPSALRIAATFGANTVEIGVPEQLTLQWCTSDLVSLCAEQPVPGGVLRIVLEKDFACLVQREGEDESDNFPHPGGAGRDC